MGGGSKSTSTQTSQQQSTSGSSSPWANPYAVAGVNEIMDVYNANKGNLAGQTATANAMTGKLGKAYDTSVGALGKASSGVDAAAANYAKAAATPNAGQGYYNDVLAGKYLNGNPYLAAIINSTNADVTNGVNSQFSSAGRYGSGAYTGELAKQIANADAALRYGDYNNQMGRMDTAAAGSSNDALARLGLTQQEQNLAQQREQSAQSAATQNAGLSLAQQQLAAQLPYMGSDDLAKALSALFSGGSSSGTSSGTSTSTTSNGIGGMLGGVGSILSGVAAF